jgi:hypothetical protein
VLSGADLGVRVVTTADGLRADVYAPRDVSAGVRFSASLSNLTGWDYEQTPPSVTYSRSAPGRAPCTPGPAASPPPRRTSPTWRGAAGSSSYVDQRDEADAATNLQQAADDAVAQGIGTVALSVTVADTPAVAYGATGTSGTGSRCTSACPGRRPRRRGRPRPRGRVRRRRVRAGETITPAVGTSDAKAIRPGPTQKTLAKVAAGLARLTATSRETTCRTCTGRSRTDVAQAQWFRDAYAVPVRGVRPVVRERPAPGTWG